MPAPSPHSAARFRGWVSQWSSLTAPTRGIIAAGTGFSLLILISSIWTGFLGTASPLWDMEWFRATRGNGPIVIIASAALIAGCLGLVVCWLLLGRRVFRRDKKLPPKTLITAFAWWATPLFFTLPLFGRDIFSYIAQGRLVANGFDPYRWGIDSVTNWQEVGVDSLWTSTLTPYGPVMLSLQRAIAVAVGPLGYHAVILAYRLVATVSIIVAVLIVCRIAERYNASRSGVLWAILINPLVLFAFVVAAHNDALMIALLVGSLAAALKKHPTFAIVLLTLAVGTKAVAIVALPIIGIIHLGDTASFARKLKYWLASGLACLVMLWLIGLVQGLSLKWLLLSSTPAIASSWFAPTAIVAAALAGVGNLFGLPFAVTFVIGKAIAIAGAIGAGSYFLLTRRSLDPLHRLVLAFSAVIFFSPVIYPWYVAWPLFVATAAGLAVERRGRLIVAVSTIFFVAKDLIAPFGYSADALYGVVQGILAAIAFGLGAVLLWLELASHAEDTRRLPRAMQRFVTGTEQFSFRRH